MRNVKSVLKVAGRVAGIGALALVLSGCFFPLAAAHKNSNPDTRPWWCHSSGGGHGGHGSEHYEGVEKGMLSWEDCLSLSKSLDAVNKYAAQYPTRGAAEDAGISPRVNYVKGMGTHHLRGGIDGNFDPTKPEFLQYGGNSRDSKLVGMSWYVRTDNGKPPAGFPGDNDWWHTHEYLCLSNSNGLVIGDGLTDAECAARGGYNVYLGNYWMVHTWIVPGWQHQPDVFVNHHPCLLASGPAAADHACWDMAGGGGHGGHDAQDIHGDAAAAAAVTPGN